MLWRNNRNYQYISFFFFLKKKGSYLNFVIIVFLSYISASFCVISAKAVSGMIQLTFDGYSQLGYPSLYIMIIVMLVTAVLQVK